MSCTFCRVVATVLTVLAAVSGGVLVSVLATAAAASAAPDKRHQIVVYYANETTAQAAQSANYRILLSVLRSSQNPDAGPIADALVRRTPRNFPPSSIATSVGC